MQEISYRSATAPLPAGTLFEVESAQVYFWVPWPITTNLRSFEPGPESCLGPTQDIVSSKFPHATNIGAFLFFFFFFFLRRTFAFAYHLQREDPS